MNNIRIPTLLAFLFIGGVLATITMVSRYATTPTEADAGTIPKEVVVTNITDAGFTVTWQTEKPTRGVISVSSSSRPTKFTFFDERNTNDSTLTFTTHSVQVRELQPQTSYSFTILPSEKTVGEKHEYEVTTGPSLPLNSNQLGPSYGTVMDTNGSPADGALVYINLPGSQVVSTLVKSTGSFLLPLNLIRKEDLSAYLPVNSERVPMTITVKLNGSIATATSDTLNDSPIPEMILGQSYDFRGHHASKNTSNEKPVANTVSSSFLSVLGSQNENIASNAFQLLTPKQGAAVSSFFPFITGTGLPGKLVSVTLGIKNSQVGTTTVTTDGTWTYTPKKALDAGNQSVTVSSTNKENNPIAITHLFEVLKSGTQVLGVATPSGIPTISVPTLTPTRVASISPTLTVATPTPDIPTTSTILPTTLLLGAGIIVGIIGLLLLAL
jgi:hypothetical protein